MGAVASGTNPGEKWVLTRADDFNTSHEIKNVVFIENGAQYKILDLYV